MNSNSMDNFWFIDALETPGGVFVNEISSILCFICLYLTEAPPSDNYSYRYYNLRKTFCSTYSVFLFSMDTWLGPPSRSFLTSTASALTLKSISEVQGASHDPGCGVDTCIPVLELAKNRNMCCKKEPFWKFTTCNTNLKGLGDTFFQHLLWVLYYKYWSYKC